MLPQFRAGVRDRAGRARELRDHAHHPDLAELRVADRDHVFAGGVLRVLEDPRHVVHGAGHRAALPEARQDLLLAPAGHPLADDGVQFPAVRDPRRVVGKPRIGRQVRPADRRRQPLEDALAAGRQRDPRAAGGAVEVAGRGVREFVPRPLREDPEGRVLRDIRDEEPEEGLVEADIDHLAAARRGAVMDGRHHREGARQSCDFIGQGDRRHQRRGVGEPGDRDESAHGLGHGPEPRTVPVRPGLAEP